MYSYWSILSNWECLSKWELPFESILQRVMKEGQSKEGSSHFDENRSIWYDTAVWVTCWVNFMTLTVPTKYSILIQSLMDTTLCSVNRQRQTKKLSTSLCSEISAKFDKSCCLCCLKSVVAISLKASNKQFLCIQFNGPKTSKILMCIHART